MGISVYGPTYIFGDNKLVLCNMSIPDSMLQKKLQSITYQFVHKGVARDEWRMAYVNTHENHADLLTKCLPSEEKQKNFVQMIQHHLFSPSAAAA